MPINFLLDIRNFKRRSLILLFMLDKSIIERKTVPINPLADKAWAWDMISAIACGSSAFSKPCLSVFYFRG